MDQIDYEQKINNEIKQNVIEFYKNNKKKCDSIYKKLTNIRKLDIYENINESSTINTLLLKSSIVILTANDFEQKVLHLNIFKRNNKKIKHVLINCSNNKYLPFEVNMYFMKMGEYYVLHMHAKETGAYTLGGAADLIRYVLKNDYCFPTAIISFGICFGNDYKEQKIGDTIIVKKLYPYFMSTKITDKSFFVKDSNVFEISTQLDAKIRHLRTQGKFQEKEHVYYGNMITGEAVISNVLIKEIFIEAATNQPILGGEMEGYALFKECQGYECSIPCLLVKSICDWGACKNIEEDCKTINLKDKLQAYAAEQAYKVLTVFMEDEPDFFKRTVYEQVKEKIKYLYAREKVLIPEIIVDLLDEILKSEFNDNLVIIQKCMNSKGLSLKILHELSKENLVEKKSNTKTIYQIKL